MFEEYDVIVVGCGLSGCVIAERYANTMNKKVMILDKRDHIGGNCYDFVDETTNILCSKYGPHFFHTNDEDVWEYIHRFADWERYEHKCVSSIDGKLVPVPVNITTVNMLCDENLKSEEEMDEWLEKNQVKYEKITNGEEMSQSLVGKTLYEKIFKNYTYKQWAKYPSELKPEILARIPIRRNFDNRYFTDKYQVLPIKGYTEFFKNLLNNDNIHVSLNTDYFDIKDSIAKNKVIIYTGPIDRYFSDLGYEKLEYRSIDFVFEIHENMNYYQPYTQVNYPNSDEVFTRITEYKHPYNQQSKHTIITKEYTNSYGEPYYPVLNDKNLELFEKYKAMSIEETKTNNIHFIGRLANYKYFNMDQAIKNSLDYFNSIIHISILSKMPSYSIVVALHNENLDWIEKMDKKNLAIYNKGDRLIENATPLPNIGRDPQTFIHHIIKNYDSLPDYLFLVQGNPFDHMVNINADNFQEKLDRLLEEKIIENMEPLFIHMHMEALDMWPGIKTRKFFNLMFDREPPELILFAPGCQYVVPRKNILKNPLEFYIKLDQLYTECYNLTNDNIYKCQCDAENELFTPWTSERFLSYIFSNDFFISENFYKL